MTDKLTCKNKRTGETEAITMREVSMKDWGFSFLVDGELEAFKAAYEYRNSKYGVRVEFAGGAQTWMVTVFNAFAKNAGIDGAK